MKIIIPGGTGQIGNLLAAHLHNQGHEVLTLSREQPKPAPWRSMQWDARSRGAWVNELNGADAVINLSGSSINTRLTQENRKKLIESRVMPTRLLGEVISGLDNPPRVWLNASAAAIYRHALDRPQDEFNGDYARRPGGPPTPEQPGLPETWAFTAEIVHQWEAALRAVPTPRTRKIALRTTLVMSPGKGGIFDLLSKLTRLGAGGPQGPGNQYVSWIHGEDYARVVDLLLAHPEVADDSNGVINMSSPNPMPNRDFMRQLRHAWGVPIGLPAPTPLLQVGTFLMRTEPGLILKSTRVTSEVLRRANFHFEHPEWSEAAKDLVEETNKK